MDSSPELFGSGTGEFVASLNVHFPPDEVTATSAIADGAPNSAT